jgi:hypothetical protein
MARLGISYIDNNIHINSHDSRASVIIVHRKNPYSLPGLEPDTSGFVVVTSSDQHY